MCAVILAGLLLTIRSAIAGGGFIDPNAGYISGEEIWKWVQSHQSIVGKRGTEEDYEKTVRLMAYVEGVYDANTFNVNAKVGGQFFCKPSGVRSGQLTEIVVSYVQAHPEQRHLPAAYLVTTAIAKAYPCVPAPTRAQ